MALFGLTRRGAVGREAASDAIIMMTFIEIVNNRVINNLVFSFFQIHIITRDSFMIYAL